MLVLSSLYMLGRPADSLCQDPGAIVALSEYALHLVLCWGLVFVSTMLKQLLLLTSPQHCSTICPAQNLFMKRVGFLWSIQRSWQTCFNNLHGNKLERDAEWIESGLAWQLKSAIEVSSKQIPNLFALLSPVHVSWLFAAVSRFHSLQPRSCLWDLQISNGSKGIMGMRQGLPCVLCSRSTWQAFLENNPFQASVSCSGNALSLFISCAPCSHERGSKGITRCNICLSTHFRFSLWRVRTGCMWQEQVLRFSTPSSTKKVFTTSSENVRTPIQGTGQDHQHARKVWDFWCGHRHHGNSQTCPPGTKASTPGLAQKPIQEVRASNGQVSRIRRLSEVYLSVLSILCKYTVLHYLFLPDFYSILVSHVLPNSRHGHNEHSLTPLPTLLQTVAMALWPGVPSWRESAREPPATAAIHLYQWCWWSGQKDRPTKDNKRNQNMQQCWPAN